MAILETTISNISGSTYIRIRIIIMVDGSLVRLVGLVSLDIMRECFVRENGLVICSKVWEKSTGQMEPFLEDIFIGEKRKMENFNGLIEVPMKVTSTRISSKAKVFLSGKMVESIKDSGRTT